MAVSVLLFDIGPRRILGDEQVTLVLLDFFFILQIIN